MSYCRFSTDDFQSDVYVYPDLYDGITVDVADYRIDYMLPLPPQVDPSDTEAWLARHLKVRNLADRSPRRLIGLSRDGGHYSSLTYREAADLLQSLADEGYRVPDGVIDDLRHEADEMESIDKKGEC